MPSAFDPAHLSPSDFDGWIATLEEEVATLRGELRRAEDRLTWARTGRSLFADPQVGPAASNRDPATVKTGPPEPPAPTYQNGAPSSLREAVLRVFLDQPAGARLPAGGVIGELEQRGWMPDSPRYAKNTVRQMLRDMAMRNQLERVGRGLFALAPDARAQGEQLLVNATKGSPGSLQRQIISALTELGRPATPSEIFALMERHGYSSSKGSVHNTLPRLLHRGDLVRTEQGYQLASQNGAGPSENGASGSLLTTAQPQEAANE